MFKNIKIENFRGINSCSIEDLNTVNLFFGKNNSGKSTLLEAIFLLAGMSNPELTNRINIFRDYRKFTENEIKYFYYNLNTKNNIEISGEYGNNKRNLEISYITLDDSNAVFQENYNDENRENPQAIDTNFTKKTGLKYRFSVSNGKSEDYISELIIRKDGLVIPKIDEKYKEYILGKYINPKFSLQNSFDILEKIIKQKQKEKLIKPLQKIESKIIDISIVGNDVMVDVGLEELIPINFLGDGIRKILAILSAIEECQNGVLLIDEIENGLHYSVMSDLWSAIFESAKLNNTQIFATTHSIDLIIGLKNAFQIEENKKYKDSFSAFSLIHNKKDELVSVKSNIEQIDYALEYNMEIR